jgi:hypothetical protein
MAFAAPSISVPPAEIQPDRFALLAARRRIVADVLSAYA